MNTKQLNILISSTLLISYSCSSFANGDKENFQSQAHIYPQPQAQASKPLESQAQLEARIKGGVTAMLNEPTWADRMDNAVKHALKEQAQNEQDKKEIIALIVEELKTNGPGKNGFSKQTNIALNSLPKEELKNTLDSIVKNASTDINQQVSDYRESIKTTKIVKQESNGARTQLVKNEPRKRSNQVKGWIYVGQFINKNWSEKLLNVDVGLPQKGKDYLLKFSANMRDSLPSKKLGMSNVVTSLTSGDKIKVLNVHPSGSKGHYWALVEWLKQH
jgi:hypothetical protein